MLFIPYISAVIGCAELSLALIKYFMESKRKKYSNTIKQCSALIDDLYKLRELYLSISEASSADLFNTKIIKGNPDIPVRKEIMRLLTNFEGIAEGMALNVFDYKLYIILTPKEIIDMYVFLQKYIIEERSNMQYNFLFDKSEAFIKRSTRDFGKKITGQRIPKKYKDEGR